METISYAVPQVPLSFEMYSYRRLELPHDVFPLSPLHNAIVTLKNRIGDFMLKIGLKERENLTLRTVPLGPSGWCPGGVQGVEPLPQPPKKNTEQPPELRAPYRTARKRPRVVLGPLYAGGASCTRI